MVRSMLVKFGNLVFGGAAVSLTSFWPAVASAFFAVSSRAASLGSKASAPPAPTRNSSAKAVAVLILLSNMVFSTPSAKVAALAEIAPLFAARSAPNRLAALTVAATNKGGTPADAVAAGQAAP